MVRVPVSPTMIQQCFDFATIIINGDNQYARIPSTTGVRIERTFVGKLAELCFLQTLNSNGKRYPMGSMFTIYEGQENTDGYDFVTKSGHSVDIKSASKPYHSRIMVPIDQFNSIPKDYYVGVRINAKVDDQNKILMNTIQSADIFGYCTYQQLSGLPTFGKFGYPCKAIGLNRLSGIQQLLDEF